MPTVLAVVIALTLFPRLTVAGVWRQLAAGLRLVWPDPSVPLPTDGALAMRRQQLGITPVRHLFRACCHFNGPHLKGSRFPDLVLLLSMVLEAEPSPLPDTDGSQRSEYGRGNGSASPVVQKN